VVPCGNSARNIIAALKIRLINRRMCHPRAKPSRLSWGFAALTCRGRDGTNGARSFFLTI